jgi:hypothetical protein
MWCLFMTPTIGAVLIIVCCGISPIALLREIVSSTLPSIVVKWHAP